MKPPINPDKRRSRCNDIVLSTVPDPDDCIEPRHHTCTVSGYACSNWQRRMFDSVTRPRR